MVCEQEDLTGRPCWWTWHHGNNVKLCVEPLVNAYLLFLNQELEDSGKQEQTQASTAGEMVTVEGVIWGALEWELKRRVTGQLEGTGHREQLKAAQGQLKASLRTEK